MVFAVAAATSIKRRPVRSLPTIIQHVGSLSLPSSSACQQQQQQQQQQQRRCRHHSTQTGNGDDDICLRQDIPPILRGQESPNLNFRYQKHTADDPERLTCNNCGFVVYENPKIVTGSVVSFTPSLASSSSSSSPPEPLILLCRRAIPPRRGYWNLPAGYMETGESLHEAAVREAKEEATAKIKPGPLISIYDISHIGQVHMYYAATLLSPEAIQPGYESLEVKLVPFSKIPWDELAFPTVSWALMHWQQFRNGGERPMAPASNPMLEGHMRESEEGRSRRHARGSEGAGKGEGGRQTSRSSISTITSSSWFEGKAGKGGGGVKVTGTKTVKAGSKPTTNIWYSPSRGLYVDNSWLKRGGVAKERGEKKEV